MLSVTITTPLSANGALFDKFFGMQAKGWMQVYGSDKEPKYMGSEKCNDKCHIPNYHAWKGTEEVRGSIHSRTLRKGSEPGAIIADFNSEDPDLTFTLKDVDYVVGGVMGAKSRQCYLTKIGHDYYVLPAQWIVATKDWVPFYARDDEWKRRPWRRYCAGCHVTAYNPETRKHLERGVACEECHGPGDLHIEDKGRKYTIASISAQICGQCHFYGTDKSGQYAYPVNYRLQDNLASLINPELPATGQNDPQFWENGLEKGIRNQYVGYLQSRHARALEDLRKSTAETRGKPKNSCLRCHSADYLFAWPGKEPTLETAKYGITCIICHDPMRSNGEPTKVIRKLKSQMVCGTCHVDDHMSRGPEGKSHVPCPEGATTCVDCHMVPTGQWGRVSHTFFAIPPWETKKSGIPNSCTWNCHKDRGLDWAETEYNHWYPQSVDKKRWEQREEERWELFKKAGWLK